MKPKVKMRNVVAAMVCMLCVLHVSMPAWRHQNACVEQVMIAPAFYNQTRQHKAWIPMTFFTIVRAMTSDTLHRQLAALHSWHSMPGGARQLILVYEGNNTVIARMARTWGWTALDQAQTDASGVPLLNHVFARVARVAMYDVLCFVNTDISFPPAWYTQMQPLVHWARSTGSPFLIAGPRLEFPVDVVWDPTRESWHAFKRTHIDTPAYTRPVADQAIDWFVFAKGSYAPVMPAFRMGRYAWDSWMVHHAVTHQWTTLSTYARHLMRHKPERLPALYGLHWGHTRAHQHLADGHLDDGHNIALANAHGGWSQGRLQSMKHVVRPCVGHTGLCIHRNYLRVDVNDKDL